MIDEINHLAETISDQIEMGLYKNTKHARVSALETILEKGINKIAINRLKKKVTQEKIATARKEAVEEYRKGMFLEELENQSSKKSLENSLKNRSNES